MDLDAAIEKLEADLATLRRARDLLTGGEPAALTRRLKADPAIPRLTDEHLFALPPAPKPGRDRASVTALYAALAPFAGTLEPKACRAIKMRGAGKMPIEIAAAMKLETTAVDKLLSNGRYKLERARQGGGAPAPAASAGDDGDDPEPAPLDFPDQILVDHLRAAYPPAAEEPRPRFVQPPEVPGVNEIVERRLEKIRQRAGGPLAIFEVGKIVVIAKDEADETFARIVANLDNGMTQVWLVDRAGKDRGRKAHMLAPGEVLRLASERRTARGTTRYELHDLPAAAIA